MTHCESGCRRHVLTWWSNDADVDWMLCGVCSDRLADALVAAGYYQVADDRESDASRDRVAHAT